jgi:DNA-binding response OmpR family regulator
MMEHDTILYISNRVNSSNSVLAALKEKGYEVVSTNSPNEGVALLYVMHSVVAVVLDLGTKEQAGFDVARSLRQIRPTVPVILSCGDRIDWSPLRTNRYVSTHKRTSALNHLLTAEPVI